MSISIGLFGFGVVGQGFYHILSQKNGAAPGRIARICVRTRDKERPLPAGHFTFNAADILNDPEITHIVEATDRPDEAFQIVRTALLNGKTVISANKKMLADRLATLHELERRGGGRLLYEAAACGSIPVFRNLEQFYAHDEVTGIQGIFNGSTNYILSKMTREDLDFTTALQEAQKLGFAETDPTLDVEAFDPAYKLTLLTAQALGRIIAPEDILRFGIRNVAPADLAFARKRGWKLRLLAEAGRDEQGNIHAHVIPTFVTAENPFYALENEYNGILIRSKYVEQQLLTGKGAGSLPTGFAVLSDVHTAAQRNGHRRPPAVPARPSLDRTLKVYWRSAKPGPRIFHKVLVQHASGAGIQRIGITSLRALAEHRDILTSPDHFIAQAPD